MFFFLFFLGKSLQTIQVQINNLNVAFELHENEAAIGSGIFLKSAFDTIQSFDFTIPETIKYKDKEYTITTIGDYAYYKTNIATLYIPKTIKILKSSAFESCRFLTKIDVDPQNEFFTSVNNFLTSKNMTVLYRISFEDADQGSIPSQVTFFSDACFSGSQITSFQYLPRYKGFGEGLFHSCRKLKKVNLLKAKITKIPNRMFMNCPKLSEVILPPTIDTIGDKAFKNTSLARFPTVDKFQFLGTAAFQNTNVKQVDLFVDNITHLQPKLFKGCLQLEQINLPDALEDIDQTTFEGCKKLMTVIYRGGKFFNKTGIFTATYPKVYVYHMRYPWWLFCNIDVFEYDPQKHPSLKVSRSLRGLRL